MIKQMTKMMGFAAAVFTMVCLGAAPAHAGWKMGNEGRWWENEDGTRPADCFLWLDTDEDGIHEYYCFGPDGYLVVNTALPDGGYLDGSGALTVNGQVQIMRKKADGTEFYGYGSILDQETLQHQIEELINKEREKNGLSRLTVNQALSQNAQLRSWEIKDNPGHTRKDGTKFSTAITVDYEMAGENIVYMEADKYMTERELGELFVKSWLESEGHKKNIVRSTWRETGVGVHIYENTVYVVQLFIN